MVEHKTLWSEQSQLELLAGMIHNPDVIPDVLSRLKVCDLHRESHRKVFQAVVLLWERRAPLTPASVAEELKSRGWLGELGDNPYQWLGEMWVKGGPGSPLKYLCDICRGYAIRRQLVRVGRQIEDLAGEPATTRDEVEHLLGRAEAAVYAVGQGIVASEVHSAGAVVGEFYDVLDRREASKGACGIQTGLLLDEILGGLQPGELGIVAARPGQGKTALALTIAKNASGAGYRTLFVSLEQPRVEIIQRLVSDLAGIETGILRRGSLTERELELVSMAGQHIYALPLTISDQPGQRLGRIWADARRLSSQGGLGLVVIDYIQLIEPDSRKEPRHEQVARISRTLKIMARDLGVPVVVAAQLNREVENRSDRKPRLADLRESGSIEADADYVVLLHDPGNPPWALQAIVAKNRSGPVGEALLRFYRPFGRITDPSDVFARDD